MLHPLAEAYLRRLRRAGRYLPRGRLDELTAEIEGHLSQAIRPGASELDALNVIERLGPPGEIIETEQPSADTATNRRGWREWATVVLLPLGGFVFGIGWLVAVVLLWTSRAWTTRDKVIGTLIIPGGMATGVVVLLTAVTSTPSGRCSGITPSVNIATGMPLSSGTIHCIGGESTSSGGSALWTALLVVVTIAPIVSAIYLSHRAR